MADALLSSLPRRNTDGAYILDERQHLVRVKGEQRPPRMIRRSDGRYEKQYRYLVEGLPVAYKAERNGRYLYVVPDALTSHSSKEQKSSERPVPPCIQREEGGSRIAVVLADLQPKAGLRRVGADEVTVAVLDPAEDVKEALADVVARVLRVKQSAIHVLPGKSTQSRVVKVENLSPREVYERLTTEEENNLEQSLRGSR